MSPPSYKELMEELSGTRCDSCKQFIEQDDDNFLYNEAAVTVGGGYSSFVDDINRTD